MIFRIIIYETYVLTSRKMECYNKIPPKKRWKKKLKKLLTKRDNHDILNELRL